jgi:hypothetical protein
MLLLAAFVAACGPAPTPSPSPTQTPVQASPNPALVEFETHIRDATTRQGQLVRDLAAATTGANAQLGLAARGLGEWAAEEESWLEAHPADACYEDAWQTFVSGVDDIATAASVFEGLAAQPSPPNESEGAAAGEALATGTSALNAAAGLANQARAACR